MSIEDTFQQELVILTLAALGSLSFQEEDLQHEGRPLSSLDDSELRKSSMENYDEDFPDTMDEIIQESRMRKEEAAREREELERQRGELDEEFSNIFGELSFRPPKAQRPIERVEPDSYDKLMKEMIFDRKATATERVLAEKR